MSGNRPVMLSRSSNFENQGQGGRENDDNDRNNQNGSDNDNEDDDDIMITSASTVPTGANYSGILHNEHSQRRIIGAGDERQRQRQQLRRQRQIQRNRRARNANQNTTANAATATNIDNPILIDSNPSQEAASGFYTNPNTHIQDDGPILITSDTEDLNSIERTSIGDLGTHSDTGTSGWPSSGARRIISAADLESASSARTAQREHLLYLLSQQPQQNSNSSNDVDDEIQFVGERELPDLQILQSTPGYELHTPSGPLFVPTTAPHEIRRAGARSRASLGGNRVRNTNAHSFLGLVRPNGRSTPSQETLPQRQLEANQRAREAAGNTVADRVRRRPQRTSVRIGNEGRNVRPRNHPILSLEGLQAYSNMYRFLHSLGFRDDSMAFQEFGGFPWMSGDVEAGDGSDVPANVMRILQSRDEERENQRIQTRNNIATTERNKKAKEARVEVQYRKKFSNNLGEAGQNDVCVLCGITLLEGIPENCFDESAEKRETDVKKLVKEGFISPWRAWARFTKIELDLSKKVFFGTCGHMYCGRCVNNIMRFRGLTARQRKDELNKTTKERKDLDRVSAWDQDFENPAFSAPLKCIADGCTKRFTGKTPFNELYV